MNLKSCDECGVVLDLSKMNFITIMPDENEADYMQNIEWGSNCYYPVLPCPVCKSDIVNEEVRL